MELLKVLCAVSMALLVSCSQSPTQNESGSVVPQMMFKKAEGLADINPPLVVKQRAGWVKFLLRPDNGKAREERAPFKRGSIRIDNVPVGWANSSFEIYDSASGFLLMRGEKRFEVFKNNTAMVTNLELIPQLPSVKPPRPTITQLCMRKFKVEVPSFGIANKFRFVVRDNNDVELFALPVLAVDMLQNNNGRFELSIDDARLLTISGKISVGVVGIFEEGGYPRVESQVSEFAIMTWDNAAPCF